MIKRINQRRLIIFFILGLFLLHFSHTAFVMIRYLSLTRVFDTSLSICLTVRLLVTVYFKYKADSRSLILTVTLLNITISGRHVI